MYQQFLMHPGYTRINCFRVLKTKEGNILVCHYKSKDEDKNEFIKTIFDLVWLDKDAKNKTIEEIVSKIEKENEVSISIEELTTFSNVQYFNPRTKKVCLLITKKVA